MLGYSVVGLIAVVEIALLFLIFPTIKKDEDDGSTHK